VSWRTAAGLAAAVLALTAAPAVVGCGSSGGSGSGSGGNLTLMLDFFPNADHAPIYAAQAGGRFRAQKVGVKVRAPSDPSEPIKLVAAGKVGLGISYEPELLRARDRGLPVVAVAALVHTPLTTIISLPKAGIHSAADLRGKTVGTAGIDYQSAYLQAILARAHVPASSVTQHNVGFNLVPALLTGKADAILGGYWNYEAVDLRQRGKDPQVIRIEQAGVPAYDELVIVARSDTVKRNPQLIRRFLAGLAGGAADLRRDPAKGVDALLAASPDLQRKLQEESVRVTLPYFEPEPGKPYGYMDPGEWQAFARFMAANHLLKSASIGAAFTNALLPHR
jgi:putative hydroxymethylpyrimidine transport system substrate-binding protein